MEPTVRVVCEIMEIREVGMGGQVELGGGQLSARVKRRTTMGIPTAVSIFGVLLAER